MKPGLPQGVRDFLPAVVNRRNYIFNTVRKVTERYGFVPIETPSVENLSTLLGKYGDEGDKLIFKILNNGDFLKKADQQALTDGNSDALASSISKRGLRYDLTVPFARYVVMNQNELAFPFKRYQIQPVWRADRPQKNRYREFYQCDADVVGSDSLLFEAEFVQIYDQVFSALKLPVVIRLNNRKILTAIAEIVAPDLSPGRLIGAIDKIDKIGVDRVIDNIAQLSSEAHVDVLRQYLTAGELGDIKSLSDHAELQEGISELETVYKYLESYTSVNKVEWDLTLARGLDYYTGCIYEVAAEHDRSVSIGGGGRYANLTEMFGLKNMPGVGISFGADRIYNMLDDLGLWPEANSTDALVLIATDSEQALQKGYEVAMALREQECKVSVYPEPAKWKKQFKYADQIRARYVLTIGENELSRGQYALKDMQDGVQNTYTLEGLREVLK